DRYREQSGGSEVQPEMSGSHRTQSSLMKSKSNGGGHRPDERLRPKKRKLEKKADDK
ncbi:Hypothetical predicted protein, partial [Mytilus galloprovincialis]